MEQIEKMIRRISHLEIFFDKYFLNNIFCYECKQKYDSFFFDNLEIRIQINKDNNYVIIGAEALLLNFKQKKLIEYNVHELLTKDKAEICMITDTKNLIALGGIMILNDKVVIKS